MEESKKTLYVKKHHTPEFVPIEVAPGESVGDVLAAIGTEGALGLSTASAQPGFVLLRGAVVWTNALEGARLYVVGCCCSGA